MTRERNRTMRQRLTFLCAGALLVASSTAQAQDPAVPTESAPVVLSPDATAVVASGESRGLVVEIAEPEAQMAGPTGVLLSLVGRTPGIPILLHRLQGMETRPIAALVVENTSKQLLIGLAVSVTWTPPDGPPRRRVVPVVVAIAPGETRRVRLDESDAAQRLLGAQGLIEVAPAGARADDGMAWQQSPGHVWATSAATVACADADWQAQPTGTDLPDAISGAITRCGTDGRWRTLGDMESDR